MGTKRNLKIVAPARKFKVLAPKRDLRYPSGYYGNQDTTAWTSWGQTTIYVFVDHYTKTYAEHD